MKQILVWTVLICITALGPLARAADPPSTGALAIDVPVKLERANVVFNMDHLAFEGDNPTGLNFMHVMAGYFEQWKTQGRIIAIFHGEAGYMVLDEARYNAVRHTPRGNPYKPMILALMARGVQFEVCAETAKTNGWVNADFLPGVKVTTAANLRIVQLVQQGFVAIQP